MTFEIFKKRLDAVKNDYKTVEEKTDSLIKGLESFLSDADGVPQNWLFTIIENELKNLIYATNESLANEKDSVQDFIDYYLFDVTPFGGDVSWEKDGVEYHYDLSKDEDVYNYIVDGL